MSKKEKPLIHIKIKKYTEPYVLSCSFCRSPGFKLIRVFYKDKQIFNVLVCQEHKVLWTRDIRINGQTISYPTYYNMIKCNFCQKNKTYYCTDDAEKMIGAGYYSCKNCVEFAELKIV